MQLRGEVRSQNEHQDRAGIVAKRTAKRSRSLWLYQVGKLIVPPNTFPVLGSIRCTLAQNSSSVGFGRTFLFRYHNRNRIGCREGILESVVEHFFLMAPRALGAIEVVAIWFAFRIGIHFNCSDPPLNAAIVDPARDAERVGPAPADWEHGEPSLAARRVEGQPT